MNCDPYQKPTRAVRDLKKGDVLVDFGRKRIVTEGATETARRGVLRFRIADRYGHDIGEVEAFGDFEYEYWGRDVALPPL